MLLLQAPVAKDAAQQTGKRRSIPQHRTRTRQIIYVLLILLGVVLFVDSVVGDRGLLARQRSRRQHEALVEAIARQKAENDLLREEVRRLTEDPSAIEEIARRELGLIRPGEKVFIVRDLPPAASR
ncbi:MAG: septum formation initiator family protein [Vicinamibacterales bacterium]